MTSRAERVGRKRPWRTVPPPVPGPWNDILDEVQADLGLELWSLARHARLLADALPHEPERLFPLSLGRHVAQRRTEALHEAPAGIRSHLRMLMKVSGRRPPSPLAAAEACEAIAEWAQEHGFPKTSVRYAEAAAALVPGTAYFTFIAGRTNRLVGDGWRADAFYSRAIRAAYRQQDWDVYVRAHLGAGRLNQDEGRLRRAANHYFSAARVALDQGHDWLAAQTYHDIFPLHYQLGNKPKAYATAEKALQTYPQHHERFPVAVHDYLLLLILDLHFAEAWPLLEALAGVPLRSPDQVLVWGTVARTAGHLGLWERYGEAEAKVLSMAPHYEGFAAPAYLGLAAGAHALGEFALAMTYAKKSLGFGKLKGDRHVKTLAAELIQALRTGKQAPAPAPPLTAEQAKALSVLTRRIQAELATWRSAPTWTAKENQSGLWTLGLV